MFMKKYDNTQVCSIYKKFVNQLNKFPGSDKFTKKFQGSGVLAPDRGKA